MLTKTLFGLLWVWLLLIVTVLYFNFGIAFRPPAWAAPVPVSANPTVLPPPRGDIAI